MDCNSWNNSNGDREKLKVPGGGKKNLREQLKNPGESKLSRQLEELWGPKSTEVNQRDSRNRSLYLQRPEGSELIVSGALALCSSQMSCDDPHTLRATKLLNYGVAFCS